jgi:hypothetical protein
MRLSTVFVAIPALIGTVLLGAGESQAGAPAPPAEAFTFVVGSVMYPPNVVHGADRQQHLAYELQLLNTGFVPVGLDRVDAIDPASGAVLASRRGAELTALVKRPEGGAYDGTLGPGLTAIVVLDVALPDRAQPPRSLLHRITISYDDSQMPPGLVAAKTYTTAGSPVLRDAPVVISPPLRGSGWIAANGCCATMTDHRGGAIPVNGRLRLPERYANDFVQIGADRRLFTGPQASLSSYGYYGADVYAVADGTVVRAHDGEPEQTPPDFPPPFDPTTAPGNWLVLDIGNGHYVLYAHLQPHSATVRAGDRVHRGQPVAKLGDTGSSSAPHLHFQVMDAPSPSASNGLPYEFDRFAGQGTVTDQTALFAGEPAPIGPALAGPHARQLPLNLEVVDFS